MTNAKANDKSSYGNCNLETINKNNNNKNNNAELQMIKFY